MTEGFMCGCGEDACSSYQRGVCANGQCVCHGQFEGDSCEHYRCRSDECRYSDNCYDEAYGSDDGECGGQGRCVAGLCECYGALTMESQCTRVGCADDVDCSNHGTCGAEGTCECDAGYMGEACELTVCGDERAVHQGLIATFYDGSGFDERRAMVAMPRVSTDPDYDAPHPGLPSDYFSIVYAGFVRPKETGWYRFRLRRENSNAYIYLNRSSYDDSAGRAVFLTRAELLRLKLEWRHYTSDTSLYFDWMGPFANSTLAEAAPTSAFGVVPDHVLLYEAVCPGGCSGRGCCIAPDTCSCDPGYTGPRCEVATEDCGTDGPSGDLVPGGLRTRFFNGVLEDAMTSTATYADGGVRTRINSDWGSSGPASGVDSNYWTAVYTGYVRADQTGWHTFRVSASSMDARLYVGGLRLFTWTEAWSQPMYLVANRLYPLRFDARDGTGSAAVYLYWEGPGFMEHLVPSTNLYHMTEGFMCGCGEDACSSYQRGGRCVAGLCECYGALTMESQCTRVGCADDVDCSNHGTCGAEGTCECDAGYMGEACELTVCGDERAVHQGLIATFYDGSGFDERRAMVAMPRVSTDPDYDAPHPGLPSDYFSIVYAGFVRPKETGWYRFRLRRENSNAYIYLNRSSYDDSAGRAVFLTRVELLRLKLEWRHYTSDTSLYFDWMGPFANSTLAEAAPTSAFGVVPDHVLLYEAVCPGGCSGRGCCIAPDTCSCDPGYGGPNCGVDLSTCGINAPDGALVQGGLMSRFYPGNLEDAITANVTSADGGVRTRINLDWGSDAPAAGFDANYWTAVFTGWVKADQTGWHTFR
ncbi:uncharacterized protein MONBRDRAFT_13199, partial [Monosiga brevicollis MX1]